MEEKRNVYGRVAQDPPHDWLAIAMITSRLGGGGSFVKCRQGKKKNDSVDPSDGNLGEERKDSRLSS